MPSNPNLKNTQHEEQTSNSKKSNFSLLGSLILVIILTTLLSISYLFYDIYKQKQQNELFQAESLAQEQQDQVNIYKETIHYESEAFEQIVQKNYDQAIGYFYKASSLSASFHDVEEIASLLSQNKLRMDDPSIIIIVLSEIINKHAKHAPTGFITSIQSQIKELERFEQNKAEKAEALKKSIYYEQEGFVYLLNKEYNSALKAFQQANRFTASLHDIPQLIEILNTHRYEMSESSIKIEVLNEIINKYSSYAPEGFSDTLKSHNEHEQKMTTSKQTTIYEQKAFQHLIDQEYKQAIQAFKKAHQLSPSFHDTKEIFELLLQHESKMSHFKIKRKVLKEIMDKYAQHAPKGFVQSLANQLLKEQKEVQALAYERQGYHYLLKNDYYKAIKAFRQASLALPYFHDVEALATLLSEQQKKMHNAKTKQKVFEEILEKYSEHAPSDFVASMKKQLKVLKPKTEDSIEENLSRKPILRIDYSVKNEE